jgi:hypothetical protein
MIVATYIRFQNINSILYLSLNDLKNKQLQEQFEDTKRISRSRNGRRTDNAITKGNMTKKTNNDQPNTTRKTKELAT